MQKKKNLNVWNNSKKGETSKEGGQEKKVAELKKQLKVVELKKLLKNAYSKEEMYKGRKQE